MTASHRRLKDQTNTRKTDKRTILRTMNRNKYTVTFWEMIAYLTYLCSFCTRFHHVRDSLLSSASGYTNYRGILNLCVVLLVMSSGRLVLENIIKYGFLVRFDIPFLFIKDPTAWPSVLAIVCMCHKFENFYLLYLV